MKGGLWETYRHKIKQTEVKFLRYIELFGALRYA